MSIPIKVSAASVLTHAHEFAGELSAKDLPRLAQALAGEPGRLSAALKTDRDSGFARVHGHIGGAIGLVCQRCERVFEWPVQLVMDLRLVFSEHEEQAVLQGSDPYLVENDELPLREMVEDEVLLALPMLARCETCENIGSAVPPKAQRPPGSSPKSATNNPFAALKSQFKKSS